MLSGDNGILQKAVDAKNKTDIAQEKEIVELAYNSALIRKMENGASLHVTSEDMNTELTNQGATASGNNPITVTFENSQRQYTINSDGNIEYSEGSDEEHNPTELTITLEMTHQDVVPTVGGNVASVNSENIPIPTGFYPVAGTDKSTGFVISSVPNDNLKNEAGGDQFVWVPVKQNQKINLTINSPENITEIKLLDPCGSEINLGLSGTIGKTYSNANITPTINGLYKVQVTTATGTESKTLIVRSLYAVDGFNDFWSSSDGIDFLKNQFEITETSALFEELSSTWGKTITNEYEVGTAYANMLNGLLFETADYTTSVNTNGGFYVGRYEAGLQNNSWTSGATYPSSSTYMLVEDIIQEYGLPLSQKNKNPWNNVTWNQAKGLAEKMYEGKSCLLTGAAWDRVLDWLIDSNNKTLYQIHMDSRDWGNYKDDTFSNTTGIARTGEFSETNTLNIYDIAGNVAEFTSQNTTIPEAQYVPRGGNYGILSSTAGTLYFTGEGYTPHAGFRVALFL